MTPKGACCRWNDLPQLFAQQARALVVGLILLRDHIQPDISQARYLQNHRLGECSWFTQPPLYYFGCWIFSRKLDEVASGAVGYLAPLLAEQRWRIAAACIHQGVLL